MFQTRNGSMSSFWKGFCFLWPTANQGLIKKYYIINILPIMGIFFFFDGINGIFVSFSQPYHSQESFKTPMNFALLFFSFSPFIKINYGEVLVCFEYKLMYSDSG